MTTPKNPEEIMKEFDDMGEGEWRDIYNDTDGLWLRSSMASLLLWAREQMPKYRETAKIDTDKVHELKDDFREWNEQARGFNEAIDEIRTLLTNEAKKITDGEKTEEEIEKIQALSNMLTFFTGKKPNK